MVPGLLASLLGAVVVARCCTPTPSGKEGSALQVVLLEGFHVARHPPAPKALHRLKFEPPVPYEQKNVNGNKTRVTAWTRVKPLCYPRR